MLSENEIQTKVNFLSSARCNHTFHKYIDITGDLIEGTLLSRILYWFAPSKDNKSKVKIYKNDEYWIAKQRKDWWEEIRITERQYDKAIKSLVKKKFVITAKYKFNSMPTIHIRPNYDVINAEVKKWEENIRQMAVCKEQLLYTRQMVKNLQHTKARLTLIQTMADMLSLTLMVRDISIITASWDKYAVDARQRKTQDTDGKPCKEIHIATRWSVHDVIGRIQNMYVGNPRVKTISAPDVDPVTGESNFDYEYGGFTKEFFADQQLLMDEISYRCLYKQEPIEREGLLFPDDKIRRYFNLPHGEPEIITAQCDTKGKGTDYFVMPILQKYGEDYYCVDCVCDNTADYEMQYENASNTLVNNQVQECEFERNAGGDRVAMEVNKRVENKGWICNITDGRDGRKTD